VKRFFKLGIVAALVALCAVPATAQSKWLFAGAQSQDNGKAAFEVGFSVPKILGVSSVGHAAVGNYAKLNWDLVKWFDASFFGIVDQVYLIAGPGVDYTTITPEDSPEAYLTGSGGFGLTKVVHRFKDKTGALGFDPGLAVFAGIKTYTPLPNTDTFRFTFHAGVAIQIGK
jgi:hypothetical protein